MLRGTGFGIAVGGGRVVSIAAPTVIGWAIMHYGLQTPYLALAGLWVLTLIGYLLGPETKGKELEDLTDEALTEDLEPAKTRDRKTSHRSWQRRPRKERWDRRLLRWWRRRCYRSPDVLRAQDVLGDLSELRRAVIGEPCILVRHGFDDIRFRSPWSISSHALLPMAMASGPLL